MLAVSAVDLGWMPFDQYLAIDAVNWSALKNLRRSPLHFQYGLTHPIEDTSTLALGRACHTAVLEPDRFPLEYVVFEGARRAGKAWDAFAEANSTRTILKTDEYENVLAIRDAVHRHPTAMKYLVGGVAEHTVTWTETINGVEVKCKARPDYRAAAIADLKTTKDAGPGAFGRTAARFGYHCQLSWYRRGVRAVTGRESDVYLIAAENEGPHDVVVHRVTDDALWAADEDINELLVLLASCKRANHWPGVAEEETDLQLPTWALSSDENEELTAEVIE